MSIPPFTLHQPDTPEAACAFLAQHREDAKILAGGSELVLLLKLGLARFKHIVDIAGISELDFLELDSTTQRLRIGPLVTHRSLECSEIVQKHFPLLAELEHKVANVRVRNVGTLAGNLCFADPHSDPGTLLLAYQARIKLRSARDERALDISDFFIDYYETALEDDEILVTIEIPKPGDNLSGTYLRFCPGERPTVAVALLIGWMDGGCKDTRLVLGCVGPTPIRAREVEETLCGRSADEILAKAWEEGERAALLCDPLEDIWGSQEYKRHIVKILVVRALSQLCQRRTSNE